MFVINSAKARTFNFFIMHSSFFSNKIFACLGAQPPCLWGSFTMKKVIINKDGTSNRRDFISVTHETAQDGGSVIVCVSKVLKLISRYV